MNTRRLTTLAMLVALNIVLSILTPVRIANFKFTFEAFPILVAAILMGPVDGLIVGGLGSFVYQLFFSGYGITITTPLWILPHALSGLIAGLLSGRKENNDFRELTPICILSSLTVTALNLLALYVDSKVFGYYSKAFLFANLPVKIAVGILLSIVYASILPKLLAYLKNRTGKQA